MFRFENFGVQVCSGLMVLGFGVEVVCDLDAWHEDRHLIPRVDVLVLRCRLCYALAREKEKEKEREREKERAKSS